MAKMDLYECALFNGGKEIYYVGYRRVIAIFVDGELIDEFQFPESQQKDPVFATHVVVLDRNGNEVDRTPLIATNSANKK